MNIITAIGIDASKFVGQLAVERDSTDGNGRLLRNDDVKLDSVKAWERVNKDTPIEHQADGSTVEAVYKAYLKPTERQKVEASGAKAAGVELKKIVGRIVDVKTLDNGDVVLLVTNGLRRPVKGGAPIRLLNVTKGTLYGISINGALTQTADELKALYDAGSGSSSPVTSKPAQVPQTPAPVPAPVAVPATGTVIDVPSTPAPLPAPAEKKHKIK